MVQTGMLMRSFQGHSSSIEVMKLTQNMLWVGCSDGSLKVWSILVYVKFSFLYVDPLEDGKCLGSFSLHKIPIQQLILVDELICTSWQDGIVQVWKYKVNFACFCCDCLKRRAPKET